MNPITQKKIRFSAAAGAVGTTPKTIRNWMQRGLVTLPGEVQGWRSFSYIDLLLLLIVRVLSEYGVPVATANDIGISVIKRRANLLMQYQNVPPQALHAGFMNSALIVFLSAGTWKHSLLIGNSVLIAPDESPTSFIQVPLYDEMQQMFARLDDWLTDDDADDGEDEEPAKAETASAPETAKAEEI